MRSAIGLIAALAAAVPLPAAAQDDAGLSVSARLALEDNIEAVPLGAPFTLIIEARHPPGGIALLPETVDVGANIIERAEARRHERRRDGDEEVDVYTLELLAFEPGDLTIPPISLAIGETTAATKGLGIFVLSGFTDEEQPIASSTDAQALGALEQMAAANPAPRTVFVEDNSVLTALFFVILLGILAYLGYRLWRRRRERPEPEPPPPPPRPAHDVALESLQALRGSPLLSRGDFKGFYTELSVILRRYIGDRYDFESLELTFDELMTSLEPRYTPGLEEPVLRHLLTLSDQVKFAKFVPRKEEGFDALNQAERLVNATTPTPAPTLTAKGLER